MFMHRCVVRQLRMERGRQNVAALDKCGLSGVFRENLDARAGDYDNALRLA